MSTIVKAYEKFHSVASSAQNFHLNTISVVSWLVQSFGQKKSATLDDPKAWKLFLLILEAKEAAVPLAAYFSSTSRMVLQAIGEVWKKCCGSDIFLEELAEVVLACVKILLPGKVKSNVSFYPDFESFINVFHLVISMQFKNNVLPGSVVELFDVFVRNAHKISLNQANQRKVFESFVSKLLRPLLIIRCNQVNNSASISLISCIDDYMVSVLYHSDHMVITHAWLPTSTFVSKKRKSSNIDKESEENVSVSGYQRTLFSQLNLIVQEPGINCRPIFPLLLRNFLVAFRAAKSEKILSNEDRPKLTTVELHQRNKFLRTQAQVEVVIFLELFDLLFCAESSLSLKFMTESDVPSSFITFIKTDIVYFRFFFNI